MLTTKEKRFANRLEELVQEGGEVAKLEKPSGLGSEAYIQGEDKVALHAWLSKVENIITNVFGQNSAQFKHLQRLTSGHVGHSYDIYPIVGLLKGAQNDLKNGFLIKQEFILAGEMFDSILEQAKYLNNNGYRDCAAVLARVVLEDALKRIAGEEGIDNNKKASEINTELKKINRYPQPQWRLIEAWLDIGNAAAHGKFDQYSTDEVSKMIEGIYSFLATELS